MNPLKLAREMDLAERHLFEFGGTRCNSIVARVLACIDASGDGSEPLPAEPT